MATSGVPQKVQKYIFITTLILIFIALSISVYYFLPIGENNFDQFNIGIDWQATLRPAILELLHGHNPYNISGFNPPWVLLLLAPIALLPPAIGASIMFSLGLFGFGYAAYRMGAKLWLVVLFSLSPPVLGNSANGNLDWIVALGCTLPPQIGLFFVLAKPQLGIGIIFFWLIEAWRIGRFHEVFRIFLPASLALGLSFIVFGPYMYAIHMVNDPWNLSLWPIGMIIGAPLLLYAVRKQESDLAITSSPFLSPYLSGHGWSIAIFGLLRNPYECIAAILVYWIIKLI